MQVGGGREGGGRGRERGRWAVYMYVKQLKPLLMVFNSYSCVYILLASFV
jgi:hypothetical protein